MLYKFNRCLNGCIINIESMKSIRTFPCVWCPCSRKRCCYRFARTSARRFRFPPPLKNSLVPVKLKKKEKRSIILDRVKLLEKKNDNRRNIKMCTDTYELVALKTSGKVDVQMENKSIEAYSSSYKQFKFASDEAISWPRF